MKEAEKINEAKKEKLRNEREIEANKARLKDHNVSDNQEDLGEGEIRTHDVRRKKCVKVKLKLHLTWSNQLPRRKEKER